MNKWELQLEVFKFWYYRARFINLETRAVVQEII